MNAVERMTTVLQNKQPDYVPHFEWLIDKKVIAALMPPGSECTEEAFVNEFGLDAICVDINYKSEKLDETTVRNEWGMIQKYTGESHSFPIDGPIHSMEDLKAYTPPDPMAPGRYATLEHMLDKYKDGSKAIILHLNDIWSIPSRLMQFDEFVMNILMEPEFIAALVKMTVDINLILAREAGKRGCQFAYTGDDVAYNNGPIISPVVFREIFLPEMKRAINGFHEAGLQVIKHTDGNCMSIFDCFLEAGFDCFDPIDPIAGMSLEGLKRDYGDKIAFKGNVNCATTLVTGSTEETIAESKKCLELGKSRGGYIFSSSNSIHSSINPQNYKAMLETWRQYRSY